MKCIFSVDSAAQKFQLHDLHDVSFIQKEVSSSTVAQNVASKTGMFYHRNVVLLFALHYHQGAAFSI
jgi:hypothetical protein